MSRLVYRDLDEFAASLIGIEGHFLPSARRTDEWWIERPPASSDWLQAFQIGGPVTFAGHGRSGCVTVAIPMTHPGHLRVAGHRLEPDQFVWFHEDQPFTFCSQDAICWVGITIATNSTRVEPELVSLVSRSDAGPRMRTSRAHLDRLRRVLCDLVFRIKPIDLSDVAAVTAAEQETAHSLTIVLEHSAKPPPRPLTRPPFPRGRIITRTLELIEAQHGEPLFLGDLCRATQVSERTLRNIFREYFGIGPMRLLKAIQLHDIRMALLQADPERDTVTSVAGALGVWDFSLFARNYKAMFGELPSRTLRSPRIPPRRHHAPLGWLRYASRIIIDEDRLACASTDPAGPEAR